MYLLGIDPRSAVLTTMHFYNGTWGVPKNDADSMLGVYSSIYVGYRIAFWFLTNAIRLGQ